MDLIIAQVNIILHYSLLLMAVVFQISTHFFNNFRNDSTIILEVLCLRFVELTVYKQLRQKLIFKCVGKYVHIKLIHINLAFDDSSQDALPLPSAGYHRCLFCCSFYRP